MGTSILAQAGKAGFTNADKDLFTGFKKLGPMFGASDKQMGELTKTMTAFKSGLSDPKIASISKKLR